MKVKLSQRLALALVLSAGFSHSFAAMYPGPQYGVDGGSGVVNAGQLTLNDNGSTISGVFQSGPGQFTGNYLVLYIDSVNGSGFTSTRNLTDHDSTTRTVITGVSSDGSSHAVTTFATAPAQFAADYALVLNPDLHAELYQLSTGTMPDPTRLSYSAPGLEGPYSFSLTWSDLGIAPEDPHSFRFESLFVTAFGSTPTPVQTLEQATGGGWVGVSFSTYHTFGVDPVPEMTNATLAIFGGVIVTSSLVSAGIQRYRRRKGA
jgi:hypothetical protein